MGNLSYSDLVFIENALTYFCIQEMKQMENLYSDKEIEKFRLSVQNLIDKVSKIKEGE